MENNIGLHSEVPATEYHKWPHCSHSRLTKLRQSPAHCRYAIDHPQEPTPAMVLGDAVDCLVFTPKVFNDKFAVAPQCMGFTVQKKQCTKTATICFDIEYKGSGLPRKQEWFCPLHEGQRGQLVSFNGGTSVHLKNPIILTEEQGRQAWNIANSVVNHPTAAALLAECEEFQLSAVWQDNNLTCKGRFDGLSTSLKTIIDLKTTIDASPQSFMRSIYNFNYHCQAAMYLRAAEKLNLDIQHFVIIAVEKDPPYAVAIYRLNEYCIDYGKKELLRWLDLYEQCCAKNEWPSYPEEPIEIGLPSWAEYQIERSA